MSTIKYTEEFFEENGREMPGCLYCINMYNRAESFYKIGISSATNTFDLEGKRLSFIRSSGYCVDLVYFKSGNLYDSYAVKNSLLNCFSAIKYNPNYSFGGHSECFSENPIYLIQNNPNQSGEIVMKSGYYYVSLLDSCLVVNSGIEVHPYAEVEFFKEYIYEIWELKSNSSHVKFSVSFIQTAFSTVLSYKEVLSFLRNQYDIEAAFLELPRITSYISNELYGKINLYKKQLANQYQAHRNSIQSLADKVNEDLRLGRRGLVDDILRSWGHIYITPASKEETDKLIAYKKTVDDFLNDTEYWQSVERMYLKMIKSTEEMETQISFLSNVSNRMQ